MVKCEFCGKAIEKGTGKKFIKDNGKIIDLCTNRCEKNMFKFKRKPRNLKWTETFHKEKNAKKSDKK